MIDIDKVEQQIAAMLAKLAPHAEGNESNNVVARIQMQVIPAFIRWKAGEMNRGVTENAVLNAFVAFVSSQMAGLCGEVGDDADEAFKTANNLLQAIGEEVGSILSGKSNISMQHVPAEHAH